MQDMTDKFGADMANAGIEWCNFGKDLHTWQSEGCNPATMPAINDVAKELLPAMQSLIRAIPD